MGAFYSVQCVQVQIASRRRVINERQTFLFLSLCVIEMSSDTLSTKMIEKLAEQKVNFCFALGRQQLFRLPKLTGSSDADGYRQIARDKLRHDVRAYKHTHEGPKPI